MIFVGDIALPSENGIEIKGIPYIAQEKWFGNLEGSLIDNTAGELQNSNGVFNDISAIEELIKNYSFGGFALANNHITDLTDIESTLAYMEKLNIPYCGHGKNLYDASKPLMIEDNGVQLALLNFGWEVIQCEIASEKSAGVNPLTKKHVLDSIRDAVSQYPDAKVIPFMHWSYELEAEPQPFERELAKKMIDLGAAGVIGSHPHRIGGFEIYKEKPIVYSLGNWLFKQNYYFGGRLSFPDFCNEELAFEWDFKTGQYQFHFFEYDREPSALTYLRTEGKESKTMSSHTPFRDLTNSAYKIWYKQNHYHKRKGLPIYYWEDSQAIIRCKNRWNKTRDKMLKVIFKKGK